MLLGLDRKFTGAIYILIVSFQTFTVSYVIHGFQKIKNNWLKQLEELDEGSINRLEQDVCFLVIENQQWRFFEQFEFQRQQRFRKLELLNSRQLCKHKYLLTSVILKPQLIL